MLVRLRFDKGVHIHRKPRKNRHLALAAASLLVPMAVMACVLAFWRLAADLGLVVSFPVARGPLSHWLVWTAIALLMLLLVVRLNRYAGGSGSADKNKDDHGIR